MKFSKICQSYENLQNLLKCQEYAKNENFPKFVNFPKVSKNEDFFRNC